ncbi:MAG: hypothetical protein IJW74_02210, partial [Oscillospiraceae bacterium]|nr:hypothetical protein [Oscillospiraceae bacterium]
FKTAIPAAAVSSFAFILIYSKFVSPRCADYVVPIIDTYVFDILKNEGVVSFVKEVLISVFTAIKDILYYELVEPYIYMDVTVTYVILLVLIAWIAGVTVYRIIKEKQCNNFMDMALGTLFIAVAITGAVFVFYMIEQGSRHLAAVAVFVQIITAVYFMPKKKLVTAAMIILIFAIGWKNVDVITRNYVLPTDEDYFDTLPIEEDAARLEQAFEVVDTGNPWDNTVAYMYSNVDMNYCYSLPVGCGINICWENNLSDDFDDLKSKYVFTDYKEDTYEAYKNAGYEIIMQGEEFVLYQAQ